MKIRRMNSFNSKAHFITTYKMEQLTVGCTRILPGNLFLINGLGETIGKKIPELTGPENKTPR